MPFAYIRHTGCVFLASCASITSAGWITSITTAPATAETCETAATAWDPEELAAWLLDQSEHFAPYSEAVKLEVVFANYFMNMTESELEEVLEVKKKTHKKVMISSRNDLNDIPVCSSGAEKKERKLRQQFSRVAEPILVAAQGQTFVGGDVADTLRKGLQLSKVEVDPTGQLVSEDLESMLKDITTYAVGLEALEWRTHEILSQASGQTKHSLSLKDDLKAIMDAKLLLKGNFHKVRNGAAQLSNAIGNYRRVMRRPTVNEVDSNAEKELLKSEFHNWFTASVAIVKDMDGSSQELLNRAKKQTDTLEGSASARQAMNNLANMKCHMVHLTQVRSNILEHGANGIDGKTMKLAYEGYTNKLKSKININEAILDGIRAKHQELLELKRSSEVLEIEKLKTALSSDDGGWLSLWSAGKRALLDQLSSDWCSGQRDSEKGRAALATAIEEVEKRLAEYELEASELNYATNKGWWTLKASGLFAVEEEVLAQQNLIEQEQKAVVDTRRDSGLTDSDAVVAHLEKIQNVIVLLSTVASGIHEISQKMNGWAHNFDNLISRQDGKAISDHHFMMEVLPIVEYSMTAITKAYRVHMGQISSGNHKALLIAGYTDKMLPPSLNSSRGPGHDKSQK